MISNKTLATIFLITINMKLAASTSSSTQRSSPSGKSTLLRKQRHASGTKKKVLVDMTNKVEDVEVQGRATLQRSASSAPRIVPVLRDSTTAMNDVSFGDNQSTTQDSPWKRFFAWKRESTAEMFKSLMEEGNYWRAKSLTIMMNWDDLLNLTCSIVKTLEQYNGIAGLLRIRGLLPSFFVNGNLRVLRKVILGGSSVYDKTVYVRDGDLEVALPLALKEDRYDRFIELLNVRNEIKAEIDGYNKRKGMPTRFGWFVFWFISYLAPWEDGMALKRFLTIRGDELRNEYPDILIAHCQGLVYKLTYLLGEPKAVKLLTDLIGQPSLLTPVIFAERFLFGAHNDEDRSNFIKYGWREAIEEGLKSEYPYGGKELWRVMQKKKPDQFPGEFPDTEKTRAAACMCFPTKQQKEEEWAKKNVPNFSERLETLITDDIFPKVIMRIVIDYADPKPTWLDVQNTKSS